MNKSKEKINSKQQRKGISLIVLVITIIVIVVLATAVILSIANNNPIENAKKAVFLNDLKAIEDEVSMYTLDKYLDNYVENLQTETSLNVSKGEMVSLFPSTKKYKEKIMIVDGKIVLTDKATDKEKEWASEINIFTLQDGTVDTSLTLPSNLSEGVYTLKYEDENGIISEYADICSLEITNENEDVSYESLIKENVAPVSATSIGVYNSSNERCGEIPLAFLKSSNTGEKQYSFAAISDTHIGARTAEADLKKALEYFENDSSIEFTTICGDLSLGGSDVNLNLYKTTISENSTKPVYAISGNHETNASFAPLAMDSLQAYTGQNLYYSFEKGNDVYIMVGIYSSRDGQEFAEGELQWLYETLETNRNKRCFLFMHLYPRDGSGDAVDLDLEGDMLNNTQGKVFYSLLSHYKNVIYFHGHSHEKFEIQEVNKLNNYDNIFGCHSVHIPSLAYPKYISNSTLVADYDASEGYIVDVYEENIVLKGRDFVTGKFLPIATYSLNTDIKTIEANTYYDSTGTIINSNSNILKSGSTWYEGTVNKNTITEISFVNNYNQSYDESWKVGISNEAEITAYRKDTKVFIEGKNGIVANSSCKEMFLNFSNLEKISGLEILNTSNITDIEGMFKNCKKLDYIDLSEFNGVKPTNMVNVFSGCSSLKSIDISYLDLSEVRKYQNLFYDCTLLENVNLGNNISSQVSSSQVVYLTDMFEKCKALTDVDMSIFSGKKISIGALFNECSSLNNVKFGQSSVVAIQALFKGCSSIEKIDISGLNLLDINNMNYVFAECSALKTLILPEVFDTSKVTSMFGMFRNASLLSIDCSNWDTTNLSIVDEFNKNAPNVIAPILE